MPHRSERAQYQQVSAFERCRITGLQETGVSYRDIAACTGHAAMTVMRVWNQWREEGHTQTKGDTGPHNVTTAWVDRNLVRMAVMDHAASSTVLNRRWNIAMGLDLSTSTFHCHLLSRDHQRLRLQWAHEYSHWRAEWQNVVFSDESRFYMSYNDGCIRVRCYAGHRNLRACILQRHRGPTPTVMVWSAIGYNMQSRLLCIGGQSEQQELH